MVSWFGASTPSEIQIKIKINKLPFGEKDFYLSMNAMLFHICISLPLGRSYTITL